MKVAETKAYFEKMLGVATMDHAAIDPLAVWAAFRLLLHQEVGDSERGCDALFLVEWGLLNGKAGKQVYLDFVRMFPVFDAGEYSHTMETRCDLACQAWPEIDKLANENCPPDRGSLERRIFDVERHEAFRTLLRWPGPWRAEVYHQKQ